MAATYSDGTTFHALVAQRVSINIDKEFEHGGMGGATQRVGDTTCAGASGVTLCLRTSRALSVMIISNGTAQQAAAAIDEAWDKV